MKSLQLIAAAAVMAGSAALADSEAPAKQDEQAIRNTVQSYVAAFNRGDAEAVASHFGEHAEHVGDDGTLLRGRAAIQQRLTELFAGGSNKRISVTIESIRFAKPDLAIERGTVMVTSPDAAPVRSRYTATHVKHVEGWKIENISEGAPLADATAYDHLRQLEWLIGRWVDQGDDVRVDTTCRWTANRTFITRSFTVSGGDRVELSGTQVIGWDPAAGQIRSWVFDSDGGFAQGEWRKEGDRWLIHHSGVLPDGGKASAVNIITPVDENRFTWQSVDRGVDGRLLPDIDEFEVVRVEDEK